MSLTNFLEHHIKRYGIITLDKSHILPCCTFENTNRALMDFFNFFTTFI